MMQTGGLNPTGIWSFNMNFEVLELGRTGVAALGGNELIAFLPGVTESVCRRLSLEGGIITSPIDALPIVAAATNALVQENITALTYYAGTSNVTLDNANVLRRKPFGCFQGTSGTGPYVFYTVVLER
jgi:hypothetical protein